MNAARTNFTTFSTVRTEVPEPFHTELGDPQETAVKPRPSHNQKQDTKHTCAGALNSCQFGHLYSGAPSALWHNIEGERTCCMESGIAPGN